MGFRPKKSVWEQFHELGEPVTDIVNSSLREGTVPRQWKEAIVIPIPKVIPTPSPDKLRPVSLIASLAKLAESLVSGWILTDISPQPDSRQYGTLKGRSTSHYLVQLVQFLHQALEDGCSTPAACRGLYSKTFDRVDNTIALHKLTNLGVRREILPWISNFLSNRRQCVVSVAPYQSGALFLVACHREPSSAQ